MISCQKNTRIVLSPRKIDNFCLLSFFKLKIKFGENFERRNVERLKFRNFKVANIKITKDELFDSFIIEFIFSFFRYYLNTQNI